MSSEQGHISGGCVLLARKMLESDLMDQSPLIMKLWVWMLLKANWRDRNQLDRGQLVTTIQEMREAMSHHSGWRKVTPSPDEIRSAYGALSKTARITVRRTTRGVVITVLNYEAYQDLHSYAPHTAPRKGNATEPAATPHDTEIRETRKKEEKVELSAGMAPPPSVLADLWNSIVGEPKVLKLSKAREAKCRLRLKERDADAWAEVFRSISNSAFLRGENERGWHADFDWIIANDTNALKVLEGKYRSKAEPAVVVDQTGVLAEERQALPLRPKRAEANFAS